MTLIEINKGDTIQILEMYDKVASTKAVRIGLHSGAIATCILKIPCGPVILQVGRQEIAIGKNLAQKILVKIIDRS